MLGLLYDKIAVVLIAVSISMIGVFIRVVNSILSEVFSELDLCMGSLLYFHSLRLLHLVITLMTRCNILRFGQNKQSANGGVGHTYGPHKIWAIRVCHTYRVAMGE